MAEATIEPNVKAMVSEVLLDAMHDIFIHVRV